MYSGRSLCSRVIIITAKCVFGDRGFFPDRGRPFLPNRLRFPSNISNIYVGGGLFCADWSCWNMIETSGLYCALLCIQVKSAWSYIFTSRCMAWLLLKTTDDFISTLWFDIVFNVCHPEVFNKCVNIQCRISQTQQNFIMFIIVLGRHVSILIEGPEDDSVRIETCCTNTIINIMKFCCKSDVWLTVHRNSVWIRKSN